jgi:hypothetical protein
MPLLRLIASHCESAFLIVCVHMLLMLLLSTTICVHILLILLLSTTIRVAALRMLLLILLLSVSSYY